MPHTSHDLRNTNAWTLLRQRFTDVALISDSSMFDEGWTDLAHEQIVEAVEVLLKDWTVSRSVSGEVRAWLAKSADSSQAVWLLLYESGAWEAGAAANDDSTAAGSLARVTAALPAAEQKDGSMPVQFWALGSNGPFSYTRRLSVTPWSDAQANYPSTVRGELDALMTAGPPTSGGKLLLLHGAPGTGKTRVTEALADAWRDWCDVDYIVDADNFFGVAAYMVSALVMGGDSDRWRLVVIEDSGEFLLAESKDRPKQGLSRLLNLADGMVGQGLKLLLLMSTNEDASELHDAVTRPGRCMAQVGFDLFDVDEAEQWLAAHGREHEVMGPMSLAQLYAV